MTITALRPRADRKPPTCVEHAAHRQAGCRTCQARAAWYNRHRRRQVRAGTWEPLGPVEPVAAHITALLDAGWTLRQIADRAGVDQSAIRTIRDRQRTRGVTAVTAAALLGVTGPAPGRWLVPAVGTRRRVQALAAIGYGRPDLARHLGVTAGAVSEWVDAEQVTAATRDRVADLYDKLSHLPGPNNIARSRARHLGYAPPLAWNDGDLDNPDARPDLGDDRPADGYDETTVDLACDGRLTHAQLAAHHPDLVETVRRLAARGMGDQQIADHLRWPGADTVVGTHDRRTRGQAAITHLRKRHRIPAPTAVRAVCPRDRRRVKAA